MTRKTPELREHWRRTWKDGVRDDYTADGMQKIHADGAPYMRMHVAHYGEGRWTWSVHDGCNVVQSGRSATPREAAIACEHAWTRYLVWFGIRAELAEAGLAPFNGRATGTMPKPWEWWHWSKAEKDKSAPGLPGEPDPGAL